MKTFFTIPVLCAGLSLAAVPLNVVKKGTNLPIATNKFIVELESTDSLNGKRSVSVGATRHNLCQWTDFCRSLMRVSTSL